MPFPTRSSSEQWRGRPIFVISGREDDRIPIDYVTANVAAMKRGGADVTFQPVDGADHFLLFSHHALVLQAIRKWLDAHRGSP